jgi:hypothetical protein
MDLQLPPIAAPVVMPSLNTIIYGRPDIAQYKVIVGFDYHLYKTS